MPGAEAAGLAEGAEAVTKGRVFWSGGKVAMKAAMKFAEENGLETLEMTTKGRLMNVVSPYLPRFISNPIWRGLSRGFAEGAVDEANFFTIPTGPRATSVWLMQEQPILERNLVNIITHIADIP